MNHEQRLIWNYLSSYAQGKSNAKKAKIIHQETGVPAGGKTYEHIRELINDMIDNEGCLIGSSRSGFFIIETEDELKACVNSLKGRILGIDKHTKNLLKNWENK